MKIEFQKNGVKLLGATPKALNQSSPGISIDDRLDAQIRLTNQVIVSCYLYNLGIQVSTIILPDVVRSRRGNVTSFSRSSSRRFRDLLLSVYVPNKQFLAITVTLPSCQFFDLRESVYLSLATDLPLSVFVFEFVSLVGWSLLMKRFRMNLIRRGLAGVWRIELQKRHVPHLHIIGFGNDINDVGDYAVSWFDAVDGITDSKGVSISCYDGFLVYGFVCKFVRSENWIKYVAAHTVKHKLEQLGWSGRQWGVFNGSKISRFSGDVCDMMEDTEYKVLRSLRRMTGYKGFNKNLFGSLQLFVSPDIIKRLISFYSLSLPF